MGRGKNKKRKPTKREKPRKKNQLKEKNNKFKLILININFF